MKKRPNFSSKKDVNIKALMDWYGVNEWQAREMVNLAPAVRRALKKNKILATVHTVAKSGMSRTISLYIIHHGTVKCLDFAYGKVYGDTVTRDQYGDWVVRINGCGMDMLFEANYRLFRALCPRSRYQGYCQYQYL